MSQVVKIVELLSESSQSWEDATAKAVERASQTIRNMKSVYVENFQAIVEKNKIVQYRVNVKISFVLE